MSTQTSASRGRELDAMIQKNLAVEAALALAQQQVEYLQRRLASKDGQAAQLQDALTRAEEDSMELRRVSHDNVHRCASLTAHLSTSAA